MYRQLVALEHHEVRLGLELQHSLDLVRHIDLLVDIVNPDSDCSQLFMLDCQCSTLYIGKLTSDHVEEEGLPPPVDALTVSSLPESEGATLHVRLPQWFRATLKPGHIGWALCVQVQTHELVDCLGSG